MRRFGLRCQKFKNQIYEYKIRQDIKEVNQLCHQHGQVERMQSLREWTK